MDTPNSISFCKFEREKIKRVDIGKPEAECRRGDWTVSENIDIFDALEKIRDCEWQAAIDNHRNLKRTFDGWLTAGTFPAEEIERNRWQITAADNAVPQLYVAAMKSAGEYMFGSDKGAEPRLFVIVDFDKKPDGNGGFKENADIDFAELRRKVLERLPWTVGVFTSRGGFGLKWIFASADCDRCNPERARDRAVQWLRGIGWDVVADKNSGACRHTKVSADPLCFINRKFVQFSANFTVDDGSGNRRDMFVEINDLLAIYGKLLAKIWSVEGGKYAEHLPTEHAFPLRTESQVWRILMNAGFPKTQKDRCMQWVAQNNFLSRIEIGHSGYNEGVYEMKNIGRVAVARSPKWIAGTPGKWRAIETVLRSRFDDPDDPVQLHALYAWLQRARRRIKSRLDANDLRETHIDSIYCPMLEIMGDQSVGKSQIYKNIILPLLGGRGFDSKKILAGDGRFNGGVLGAEVMLVDDVSTVDVAEKGRGHFAQQVKAYLYAADVSIEGKFQNEWTLENHCLCAVQLFNPDSTESTPEWSLVKDKTTFINCAQFYPIAADEKGDRAWSAINRAIARQLPAFAYFIDNIFTLPPALEPITSSEHRNGFRHYANSVCRAELDKHDAALIMLQRFDAIMRNESLDTQNKFYGVVLQATDIAKVLVDSHAVRSMYKPQTIGRYFAELEMRTDDELKGRVRAHRTKTGAGRANKVRGWIISRPPEQEEYDDF